MALITNLQPPAGTPVAADAVLQFDVIDPLVGELNIFVWVVFAETGTVELVYDAVSFQPAYSGLSAIESIPGGRRFSIRRSAGWPNQPELRVDTCACPPEITPPAGGEANTAINIGGFNEIFQTKVGVQFQFKTVQSSDGSLGFTENLNDLDMVLLEAGLAAFNGVTYTWPGADGSADDVLSTNGAGVLAWAANASGDTIQTVQTTDTTPTNIDTIAIADGEVVEIDATFVGIRTGTASVVTIRYGVTITRDDGGAGMEVLHVFQDSGAKYDTNGLTTADATIDPNSGANRADLIVTGEASTINWKVFYEVRRTP